MLERLSIRDFALIQELDLDPGSGLIILSGETGAGKSILLDALHMISGQRASRDFVRRGASRARIEACFSNAVSLLPYELTDVLGLPTEELEEGRLILGREIEADGRSYARLNGRLVSLAILKSLASQLLELHAQNEEVRLYKPEVQRELLDRYAAESVRAPLEDWKTLRQQRLEGMRLLRQMGIRPEDRARRLDLLNFQIQEILEADFKPGEVSELKKRFREAEDLRRMREELGSACRDLGDEQSWPDMRLQSAADQLRYSSAHDEETGDLRERLYRCSEEAAALREELFRHFESSAAEMDFKALEERLDLWERLRSKYAATEEGLQRFLDSAIEEKNVLEKGEEAFQNVREELLQKEKDSEKAARLLHEARVHAAHELSQKIEESLRDLNMRSARFQIHVREIQNGESSYWGEYGRDEVEFYISPNAGEDLMPLGKIASGGEASRVLLAVKSILAEEDSVPVLVFDEIDSGVSGETAALLASRLRDLSKERQVLAVTHTAQIAALADQHLYVFKEMSEGRTLTRVKPLKDQGRVDELSRLLAGRADDPEAQKLARALLKRRDKSESE